MIHMNSTSSFLVIYKWDSWQNQQYWTIVKRCEYAEQMFVSCKHVISYTNLPWCPLAIQTINKGSINDSGLSRILPCIETTKKISRDPPFDSLWIQHAYRSLHWQHSTWNKNCMIFNWNRIRALDFSAIYPVTLIVSCYISLKKFPRSFWSKTMLGTLFPKNIFVLFAMASINFNSRYSGVNSSSFASASFLTL